MSHTSMVSSEGSYTSGDFLGSWLVGLRHSSLDLYHYVSFSIMNFYLNFILFLLFICEFIIVLSSIINLGFVRDLLSLSLSF